ncbi:ABC transporter substrate-binding protein [Microbacterium murale]|uniref:Multiple sugar transport system substrate-binding protein n=1 Tax=Microbacterium murale TaxID=1081040 RepID=A0ABU0PB87_9MICO|nr:extracellular solute-binding protein [Microbacterium murale]MDQ0644202.1 multiple sugar transport system substrate-binding protein [Microbacterium murale]
MGQRRTLTAIAGFAAAALVLAGCSGTPESDEAAPQEESGPVTLEFWAWGSNVDKRVAEWNEANPDIQVNISAPAGGVDMPVKVLAAVRAGEGPDMVQAEYTQMPTYVSAGVVADVESIRGELEDAFAENVLDTVTFDDTIFGIPQDLGPALFVYRTDLFTELGVEPAETWDDFRALAEQVRAMPGDHYLANFSSLDADLFMGLALQNGAQWWEFADDEWQVNIDDEASAEVLEYWQGLVEDDLVSTYLTSSPEYIEAVASGKILGQIAGAWAPGPLLNQYPDTVGLWTAAQIPQWESGELRTFARGGSANIVLADSEHYDASVKFLSWLNASDEGAEGLVAINKFTGAKHGQEIDRPAPDLIPEDDTYWPSAVESASGLVNVQWGPNTQVAFTALSDALGAAIEAGEWAKVLPTVQSTVEDDLG